MQKAAKTYGRYSGRGVVKKVIALRLRPGELTFHENLSREEGQSSAALARLIYLQGVKHYLQGAKGDVSESLKLNERRGLNKARGVNRA